MTCWIYLHSLVSKTSGILQKLPCDCKRALFQDSLHSYVGVLKAKMLRAINTAKWKNKNDVGEFDSAALHWSNLTLRKLTPGLRKAHLSYRTSNCRIDEISQFQSDSQRPYILYDFIYINYRKLHESHEFANLYHKPAQMVRRMGVKHHIINCKISDELDVRCPAEPPNHSTPSSAKSAELRPWPMATIHARSSKKVLPWEFQSKLACKGLDAYHLW